MKRNSTILFLLISLSAFAQFPAPTNFSLQGYYVELDKCEFCLGPHYLCGPTFCSAFTWQAPTATTTATLDHYNIYGKDNNQIRFSETETGVSHWSEAAPMGEFWVTAVYSNPTGESLPSNVIIGWSALPTSNNLVQSITKNIIYSNIEQTVTVNSNKTVIKINLINANGRIIKSIQNPSKTTSISELPKGFYIVEVYCENNDILRQKIIK